jgi:transcriptional regulator with XRE-family HTH domain
LGTLYDTIIGLCAQKGIKGAKMCADLGFSKGTLTELKMGRQKTVTAEKAQKIAAHFGVSVGYLLGEEDAPETKKEQTAFSDLPESKQALMQFVQSVPEDKADMILRVMKSILESD